MALRFPIFTFAFLLLAAVPAASAGVEEAKEALEAKHFEKALALLNLSAAEGDLEAQAILGNLYFSGEGVDRDYDKAAYWLKSAARNGNAQAQATLGHMYFLGLGVRKDAMMAFSWALKAAEQGASVAQHNVASMYAAGYGTRKDMGKAYRWYNLSAQQWNAPAQYALGKLFQEGKGVHKDRVQSYMWFFLAETNPKKFKLNDEDGNALAGQAKAKLSEEMTPNEIAEAELLAKEWLEKHPEPQI